VIKYAIPRFRKDRPACTRVDVIGETKKHFRIDPMATRQLIDRQLFEPGMRNRKDGCYSAFELHDDLASALKALIAIQMDQSERAKNEAAEAQARAVRAQDWAASLAHTLADVASGEVSEAELARRNDEALKAEYFGGSHV